MSYANITTGYPPTMSPSKPRTVADILAESNAILGEIDNMLCGILNISGAVETEVGTISDLAQQIKDRAGYISENVSNIRDRLGVSL